MRLIIYFGSYEYHFVHTNKLAKCHHRMALPLRPLSVHGAPFSVPRSTHLHVICVTKEDSKMKSMPGFVLRPCAFYCFRASSEDLEQLSRPSSQTTWLK
eukprot:1149201-Pelagomonas_calceolata.AAC.2